MVLCGSMNRWLRPIAIASLKAQYPTCSPASFKQPEAAQDQLLLVAVARLEQRLIVSTRPLGVSRQASPVMVSGASSRISRLPSEKTSSVVSWANAAAEHRRGRPPPGHCAAAFIAPIGRRSGETCCLTIVASLRALVAAPLYALRLALAARSSARGVESAREIGDLALRFPKRLRLCLVLAGELGERVSASTARLVVIGEELLQLGFGRFHGQFSRCEIEGLGSERRLAGRHRARGRPGDW
jgi:hypothetical protein